MEEQAETIGLNTIELARYKAAQMGANEAQTQSILLSARRVEQYKAEQEAIKQAEAQKKKEAALAAAEARATSDDQKRLDQKVQQIINAEARKAEAEQAATDQRAVQIAESLMSEEEQISLSYERRSQIILDSTLLTGQQVNEAMAALELERQDKLRAIKDKSAAEDRERAAQTTTQLLAFEDMLMKGKSEKQKTAYRLAVNLASAEKRQNAAKIVSDSYAAAMGAYKALAGIPIIGPALGAGAAALILGAGVSFAAKSLTGRALGGQVRDGESYVVGERGPEVLTMNGGGGRIIPNEKLRGGGGKTVNQQANVTFQISTVDAQGFEELLDSSRGQIVNMINTALNESGKGALA
jgi:beta-glucosidase-like glycosyl hydrolase